MTKHESNPRREFIKGSLTGAAALGAVACGGGASSGAGPAVVTAKKIRWRLASSFPRSLDTIFGAAEVLSERVSAMTGGNFDIRAYPAPELCKPLEVMDAVQSKAVEIGQTGSYYYTGKNPALAFDTSVPFGLTARQQSAWLEEGGGLERIRKLYADFNIINFPGGNTGAQMGGWFRKPVGSMADLNGLVMRIPGMGAKVMERLGVTTQNIGGGEIYPALERGALDATEWVGPYDDEKLGFYKVAKNYIYPGWWEPGPSLSFLINQTAWDSLPSEYQAILDSACRHAGLAMQTRYDDKNPPALERLRKTDIAIRPFPGDVMKAAREASEAMLDEEAANDSTYSAILEHWRSFRASSFKWFATAELSYAQSEFR